jgi:asparaginyl-tRNA synthetase
LITQQYQSVLHAFERRRKQFAMDILFLELRNRRGSQERNVLMFCQKMKALGIDEEELWWYLDTRRFDQQFTLVLDFERLVLFVTGMTNIRDVILFQEHQ